MLYQWDLRRDDLDVLRADFWEAHPGDPQIRTFADRLVTGTVEHIEQIDRLIARHAANWRMERMETVDRNVLRMATEELLYDTATPSAVVIDEAIEIARRYGTGGSAAFINGMLDSILKGLHGTDGNVEPETNGV